MVAQRGRKRRERRKESLVSVKTSLISTKLWKKEEICKGGQPNWKIKRTAESKEIKK